MSVRQQIGAGLGLALCLGVVCFGALFQGSTVPARVLPLVAAVTGPSHAAQTVESDHPAVNADEDAPSGPKCSPKDAAHPEATPTSGGWPPVPPARIALAGAGQGDVATAVGPSQCESVRPPPYALSILRI